MSTTNFLNILQGPSKSLRVYLVYFNEVTIKVIHYNYEMFIQVFQNGLRVRHFNESLAQRPTASLVEVVTHVEYYIKGGESNC